MPQFGELDISNFDRAIYEALGADFLPFPNPDDHRLLKSSIRQVEIEGIDGPGHKDNEDSPGKVPVVFDYPEDVYNRYLLPGIRIHRNESIEQDSERLTGWLSGFKYRAPSDSSDNVEVNGEQGSTHYVQRQHADPANITYEIEIRTRYRLDAHKMRKFVRRSIKDRSFLKVLDSEGDPSFFTVIRDGDSNISEFVDSLNRHHGFMLTYKVEAEIDDHEEEEVIALTSLPDLINEDF